MNILTGAAYLEERQLRGFESYKYSSRDTSPYSKYVVNPCWDMMVQLLPRWLAPNLMTLVGFLCILSTYLLLSWYDYDFKNTEYIPAWAWLYSAVAQSTGHNLDGMDGKQARRTKTSTPLGELFDHGLDSVTAFTIPLAISSTMGLVGEIGLTKEIVFFTVLMGMLGFYATHWEKYCTGVLFLPWLTDILQQAISLGYLLTGLFGVGLWTELDRFLREKGLHVPLIVLYTVGMGGGTFICVAVSIWNVVVCVVNKECKRDSLADGLSPFFSFTALIMPFIIWALLSPNGILELELRCFCSALGIVFSNITCNLIIAQMSGVKFRVYNGLVLLAYVAVIVSLCVPQFEIAVLYAYIIVALISHTHFSYSVVNQLCAHYKIECFRIPHGENKGNS